jgi:hypothetical protein
MARKIFGRISNQSGAGVGGLRVQAWDDDWPDDNDFMGEAITDPNGDYSISYDDGHWDPAPHSITTWRPDIFIAVQAPTATGAWAHLEKSSVHKNHKLRDDLRIDLHVRIVPPEEGKTPFNPKTHGFHFGNHFTVTPSLLGMKLGTWNMGFCGGMCADALDRYGKGVPIPPDTTPPVQGTALFTELLEFQKGSLSAAVVSKIYDWQSAPDEGHTIRKHSVGWRTKQEWPQLKRELDAARPTQLVLIRVEGYLSNLSDNHQVVAIGYVWNPTSKDLTINVYDPNKPDTIGTLTMNFGLPDSKIRARDSSGQRLRGFFVN